MDEMQVDQELEEVLSFYEVVTHHSTRKRLKERLAELVREQTARAETHGREAVQEVGLKILNEYAGTDWSYTKPAQRLRQVMEGSTSR